MMVSAPMQHTDVRAVCHVAQMKYLRHDHRFMTQVVSSAIWNSPPPEGLVRLMHLTNRAGNVDRHTREKMLRMFKVGPSLPRKPGRSCRGYSGDAPLDPSPCKPRSMTQMPQERDCIPSDDQALKNGESKMDV